jgi:hypothetical protein
MLGVWQSSKLRINCAMTAYNAIANYFDLDLKEYKGNALN